MRRAALWLIRRYQKHISPELGSSCRFHPTCSQYTHDAVDKYGVARGSWLGLRRVVRCHPFVAGGYDPVP